MIRVARQPEPAGFDAKVRQPGLAHLAKGGKPTDERANFWTACLDDLYRLYGGVCAYYAIHFERVTGTASADHFAPKSKEPGLAYEWSNYRLACLQANRKKSADQDVLDPFEIEDGWFRLEPVTGRIYPSPELDPATRDAVQRTIDRDRLDLDSPECRAMRVKRFTEFVTGDVSSDFLQRNSPFIWLELRRQNLL